MCRWKSISSDKYRTWNSKGFYQSSHKERAATLKPVPRIHMVITHICWKCLHMLAYSRHLASLYHKMILICAHMKCENDQSTSLLRYMLKECRCMNHGKLGACTWLMIQHHGITNTSTRTINTNRQNMTCLLMLHLVTCTSRTSMKIRTSYQNPSTASNHWPFMVTLLVWEKVCVMRQGPLSTYGKNGLVSPSQVQRSEYPFSKDPRKCSGLLLFSQLRSGGDRP